LEGSFTKRVLNPLQGRLRIWPPLNAAQEAVVLYLVRCKHPRSFSEIRRATSLPIRSELVVNQLLRLGYVEEVRPQPPTKRSTARYTATILALIYSLAKEQKYWDRIDEVVEKYAMQWPIPFGIWSNLVQASRKATLTLLAEAILDCSMHLEQLGHYFLEETKHSPAVTEGDRRRLLDVLCNCGYI